jgi:hypothetical protein
MFHEGIRPNATAWNSAPSGQLIRSLDADERDVL